MYKLLRIVAISIGGFLLGISLKTHLTRDLYEELDLTFLSQFQHNENLLWWGIVSAIIMLSISFLLTIINKFKDVFRFGLLLNFYLVYLLIGPINGLFEAITILIIIFSIIRYFQKDDIKYSTETSRVLGFAWISSSSTLLYLSLSSIVSSTMILQDVTLVFIGSMFFAVPLFFAYSKIGKWYIVGVGVLSFVPFFFFTSYLFIYSKPLNYAGLASIFNTNFQEALEYSLVFWKYSIIFIPVLHILMVWLNIKIYSRIIDSYKKISWGPSIALSSVCILLPLINDSFLNNSLLKFSSNYVEYTNYEKVKRTPKPYSKIISKIDSNEKQTYIVIIGESLNKSHMSLYGYHRKTTPCLDSLQNDILCFSNAKSPDSYTLGSLKKILSFGNNQDITPLYEKESIVEFFNRVGFETYWISNQPFFGSQNLLTSQIAMKCTHKSFTNKDNNLNLDELLLPDVQQAIDDKSKKKIIFIHLMGNHYLYKNRYPKTFAKFSEDNISAKVSFVNEKNIQIINNYDNSVLYNDYVVASIYKMAIKLNEISWILYTSDHGENLFEDSKNLGHGLGWTIPSMYDIPLMFYISPKLQARSSINLDSINLGKTYITDNLIYSLIQLSELDFKENRKELSIFESK